MRHDVEGADFEEVFAAEAYRPGVRLHFIAHLHAEGRGGEIGLRVHPADVDLAVEVADAVAAVDREADEVGVVVDVESGAFGLAVAGADRKRGAHGLAAAEAHIDAEETAVVM